jgi:hypothetical protein
VAVVLALGAPALLPAQVAPTGDSVTPARPSVGDRVRLDLRSGGRLEGVVARATADSVTFAAERRGLVPPAVAVQDVSGFRRSLGRDRARGVRTGALVGGVLGAVVVAAGVAVDRSTDAAVMVPATLLAVPVAGLLTLIGAGLGSANAPTIWSDAAPVRVGGGPQAPGRALATLGYQLRF